MNEIKPITDEDIAEAIFRGSGDVRDIATARRIAADVMIYLQRTALTNEERNLLKNLSLVSCQFSSLIKPTSSNQAAYDWAEAARTIHDLQVRVLAVAAARIYPSDFRSLVTRQQP